MTTSLFKQVIINKLKKKYMKYKHVDKGLLLWYQ